MIDSPPVQVLLYPPAKLYELAVRARNGLYRRGICKTNRLVAPVISVGNLTVGGTGKTPCVAYIANFLRGQGLEVAILSRGYKRESRGRVEVSDGKTVLCDPAVSGDEPYLLARSCPGVRIVVDSDRYAAGQWLESRVNISAFILDDGYQHLQLARILNLALVDAADDIERERMVPFGRLREPLEGLRRADAVIVARSDRLFDRENFIRILKKYSNPDIPVFFARHEITRLRRLASENLIDADECAGKRIAAVSGIARPERFIDDLMRLEYRISLRRHFEDHHRYSFEEFRQIIHDSIAADSEAIIITEKDAANLPLSAVAASPLPVFAAQLTFICEQEADLKRILANAAAT